MISKIKEQNRGFTLVEILVTLSIISILAVMVLPQYRTGQKLYTLQRLSHKVAQDIRRTQEMTMSARREIGRPVNYGVEFRTGNNFFRIFIDDNNNGDWQPGEELEVVVLEDGAVISSVFATEAGKSEKTVSRLVVTFTPPDPVTRIETNDASIDADRGRVKLGLGNRTRSVFFNLSGLIYAE